MFPFTGNTSGVATSTAYQSPMVIESFSIVNRDGNNNTFNVYKISGSSQYNISPHDYALAVNGATSIYENTRQIVLLAGEKVQVSAQNSLDFDFTISPMKPDSFRNG